MRKTIWITYIRKRKNSLQFDAYSAFQAYTALKMIYFSTLIFKIVGNFCTAKPPFLVFLLVEYYSYSYGYIRIMSFSDFDVDVVRRTRKG